MAGVTITGNNPGALGGASGEFPAVFLPPLIHLAPPGPFPALESTWILWPDMTLVRCAVAASSVEAGSCEVTRRYGQNVKQPYDADYQFYGPQELAGWWLRLSMPPVGGGAPIVQFVGIIDSEPRTLTGSSASPSGTQNFVARGGLRILERISISQSIFYDPTRMAFSTVGRIPPMNQRDARGLLVGNRSDDPVPDPDWGGAGGAGDNYAYGGKTLWTHGQYLEYLITQFIFQENTHGPAWTLMGQTDILENITTTIDFGEGETAADMIRKLIPPKYGVDFCIVPTPAGFAINIFALSDQPIQFAGQTMPANTPTVTINRDTQIELVETHVVETTERRVDRIVAIGKRIVVCGTLWSAGMSVGDLPEDAMPSAPPVMPLGPHITLPATLVKRWSDAIEADYINGGMETELEKKDLYRHGEQFRDVYQHLGAPDNWDMDSGTWSVSCKADGSLALNDYQTAFRDTLGWIPLRQGMDYRTIMTSADKVSGDVTLVSATDNTDGTVEPETSPPLAWIYDVLPYKSSNQQYVKCESVGIGVGRPHLDWGVFLHASPNHLLANGSFSSSDVDTTMALPMGDPPYDYRTVVATVAIESDHRLALVYDAPAAQAAGDGSIMILHDEGAELWVVLPGTIVGLDDSGNLVAFGQSGTNGTPHAAPTTPTIIRNDVPRLALAMCGAIARYSFVRARAEYTAKGFAPWSKLLGRMVVVTQPGDQIQPVACVCTSVEWELGNAEQGPRTIVKTGYS